MTFVKTVVFSGLAVVIVGAATLFWLKSTTHHGQTVEVPNLKMMTLPEAISALDSLGLSYEVIDSTHYAPKIPRGAIIDQFPAAYAQVKAGRAVMLSTNPAQLPKYPLPSYKDQLVNYVRSKFTSKGFIIDTLVIQPDLSHDLVLRVVDASGKDAKEGGLYTTGSRFKLYVSGGMSGGKTFVPDLTGLTYEQAEAALAQYALSNGAVIYTGEIIDTPAAFVYRQYPEFDPDRTVNLGSAVDLWLTLDSTLLPVPVEPEDTLSTW